MSFSRGSTLSVISSITRSILGLKMWPNTALEPTWPRFAVLELLDFIMFPFTFEVVAGPRGSAFFR